MTVEDLIPVIAALPQAEKIRLAQIILQQIAASDQSNTEKSLPQTIDFDPRPFYGVAQCSRKKIDAELASLRDGWN